MRASRLNRRELGIAAGAGLAAIAVPARAQPLLAMPPTTDAYGAFHAQRVNQLVSELALGADLTKPAGLKALVKYLVSQDVLTREEGRLLEDVIDRIFAKGAQLASLIDYVLTQLGKLPKKADRLVHAVLSIAAESLRWIRDRLKDPNNPVWLDVVGADVGGALTGAIAGIPGGPPSVLTGALFGAIGASALAGAKALLK